MNNKILKFEDFKAGTQEQDPKMQVKTAGGLPKTKSEPKADSVKSSDLSTSLDITEPDYSKTEKTPILEAAADDFAAISAKIADLDKQVAALQNQKADLQKQQAVISARAAADAAAQKPQTAAAPAQTTPATPAAVPAQPGAPAVTPAKPA